MRPLAFFVLCCAVRSAHAHFPLELVEQYNRPPLQQYVMMPLEQITDWDSFRQGLRNLKRLGVSGVTTDICWGLVEKTLGHYDWAYYQKLGQTLKEEQMPWITILSTHAIGGNVGDNVSIPLSDEVLDSVPGAEYVYRDGRRNRETISYFASEPEATEALRKFYESFKKNIFDQFHGNIVKIYVGLGPASEARYPSYGAHLGYDYPSEGGMPIYSAAALASFRAFLKNRYGEIAKLNAAWGLSFQSFAGEVAPHMPQEPTAQFLQNARATRYYRDLMDWYTQTLVAGIHRGLKALSLAFTGQISELGPLFSIKVAGLHWQRLNPASPRATELAAGYEDYDPIFFAAREWKVGVTFTCLEMEKSDDAGYPRYSDPPGLVEQIIGTAKRMNVAISGENALEFNHPAPLHTVRRLVEQQDARGAFQGFTFLRWQLLVDGEGRLRPFAHDYQQVLIKPARLKVEYHATETQSQIDARNLEMFLVPVDPQTLSYWWHKRVPLRAQDPQSNVLAGEWGVIDREAQMFAIGARDSKTGAYLQMTHAQALAGFPRPLDTLILNPLAPLSLRPQLDMNSRFGDVAALRAAQGACEGLLNVTRGKIAETVLQSLKRKQELEDLEHERLRSILN